LFCFYALNFVFSSSIVFSSEGPQKRNRESTEAPQQKRTRSLSQYKKTLKGLREYISRRKPERLSLEALEYFRESLQEQALDPNNFILESIGGVFLLDLGLTPRKGQERKGLHMQNRSLHLLTEEDRKNIKISSVAMRAKYYEGSVNDFDLPGVVLSEGTEYLLEHGVERSVPGYKSPIDHVFKPYYSPQRVLSGGVHVYRKYLQSFIKIGAIRKYYLYSKWENTLEPIAYTSTYEVNFICKKDSRSQLKVTYRDDHGTQKTDVYHLAIRQVNGQDQFYFELSVSD
jgi:hypothetical protein